MGKHKTQTQINKDMVEEGKNRHWSKVHKAQSLGLESTTTAGARLLSKAVPALKKRLQRWLHESKHKPGRRHRAMAYLEQLPADVVAGLTCQCIIDCISQNRKIAATAYQVAKLLEDEVKFRFIQDGQPILWKHIKRNIDKGAAYSTKAKFIKKVAKDGNLSLPAWDRKDMIQVGMVCIELMREATGIIEISTRTNVMGRSVTLVRPTDEILQWIKTAHKMGEFMKPVYMPMVELPVPWTGPNTGGYPKGVFRTKPLVKNRDKNWISTVESMGMPQIYSAVNTLQTVPFVINESLANLMTSTWESGVSLGSLPATADDPAPPFTDDLKTDPEKMRAWRKAAARHYFEIEKQTSRRLQVSKLLYLCEKFQGNTLYFPRQLDFRGREYPVPYYLQPQGPEWASALLLFRDGTPINDKVAAEWLAIHVANCWGEDKSSYGDRVAWVQKHQSMIGHIASDARGCLEWTKADKPWKFLAACMEWDAFRRKGYGYVSHLPVTQDATTQGLQIYSMLLKDPVAGMATNVLPRDKPSDIYSEVADMTVSLLKQETRPEFTDYSTKWLAFGIDRKTTKRQTMTLPYGSTFFSCREYTTEWFYEQTRKYKRVSPFDGETYKPCNYLAEMIWEAINRVVRSARVGMDWFQEIADICIKNKVSPKWWTPQGFLVDMQYEQSTSVPIKTAIGRTIRQHLVRIGNGKMDGRKTHNGIAANVIHSFDGIGGLLGLTINSGKNFGIKNWMTVHDSYGTTAGESQALYDCLRQATVAMFSDNLLEIFRNQIQSMLPSTSSLPEVPPLGDMDITEVLKSNYYFS